MNQQITEKKLITWVLFTALICGTIDILTAFIVNYKTSPVIVLKFIASGLFVRSAFRQGTQMVYMGIGLHYSIAFFWTVLFFLSYPAFLSIVRSKPVVIVATALIIWLVMNGVVLPLSRTPSDRVHLLNVIINLTALILAYGLPFTLIAGRYYAAAEQ